MIFSAKHIKRVSSFLQSHIVLILSYAIVYRQYMNVIPSRLEDNRGELFHALPEFQANALPLLSRLFYSQIQASQQ